MPLLFASTSVILAYLIGSIPIGVLTTKVLKGTELRRLGSGRTGATNVYRVAGALGAVLTSLGDTLKGTFAVWIAGALTASPWVIALAGIAVVAGHNWSILLKFKGGAGTATTLGVLAAMSIYVGGVLIAMMLTVLVASRTASVASITVALMMGFVLVVSAAVGVTPWPYVLFGASAGALTICALQPNIKRILEGRERRLEVNY